MDYLFFYYSVHLSSIFLWIFFQIDSPGNKKFTFNCQFLLIFIVQFFLFFFKLHYLFTVHLRWSKTHQFNFLPICVTSLPWLSPIFFKKIRTYSTVQYSWWQKKLKLRHTFFSIIMTSIVLLCCVVCELNHMRRMCRL